MILDRIRGYDGIKINSKEVKMVPYHKVDPLGNGEIYRDERFVRGIMNSQEQILRRSPPKNRKKSLTTKIKIRTR